MSRAPGDAEQLLPVPACLLGLYFLSFCLFQVSAQLICGVIVSECGNEFETIFDWLRNMQEFRASAGYKSNPRNPPYCFHFQLFVVDFSMVNFGFLRLLFCRSKFKAASGAAVGYPQIIRPRSINGLADQGAAALTDGQYIERLQLALQQASISSLQERLAERKVQSVVQLSVKLGKSYYSKLIHFYLIENFERTTVVQRIRPTQDDSSRQIARQGPSAHFAQQRTPFQESRDHQAVQIERHNVVQFAGGQSSPVPAGPGIAGQQTLEEQRDGQGQNGPLQSPPGRRRIGRQFSFVQFHITVQFRPDDNVQGSSHTPSVGRGGSAGPIGHTGAQAILHFRRFLQLRPGKIILNSRLKNWK